MTDETPNIDGADEKELAVYLRAHAHMKRVLTPEKLAEWATAKLEDPADDLTDEQCLAVGFCMFGNQLLQGSKWPPVLPQRCSWCIEAAGNTKEAADAAPLMSHEAVREHIRTCPNNPLVAELAAIAKHLSHKVIRDRYAPIGLPIDDESDEVGEDGNIASRPHTSAELVECIVGEIVANDEKEIERYDLAAACLNVKMDIARALDMAVDCDPDDLLTRVRELVAPKKEPADG